MKSYRDKLAGVDVEILEFEEGVETVEKAARASGAPPDSIVKTLLVRAGGEYLLVLARGSVRVDLDALSRALGVAVVMAKAKEVREVLGVEPGAVTPLSERAMRLKAVADPGILQYQYVLIGGGATNRLARVKVSDLINALRPSFLEAFK
ncbi:MAG: YbaK/EbsC family protein [Thermoproteus sp.]